MEGGLPNTSALQKKTTQTLLFAGLFRVIIYALFISLFLGGLIAVLGYFIPYDRIVVVDQPSGTTAKITSVKISEASFVVIYMQKSGGWEEVGLTQFDKPGYYRDVVVDIGYQQQIEGPEKDNTIGNVEHRAFVVRIERAKSVTSDNGELWVREPIRDRFGRVYQKKFWWVAHGHPVLRFFRRLEDEPLVFLWDVLWP